MRLPDATWDVAWFVEAVLDSLDAGLIEETDLYPLAVFLAGEALAGHVVAGAVAAVGSRTLEVAR